MLLEAYIIPALKMKICNNLSHGFNKHINSSITIQAKQLGSTILATKERPQKGDNKINTVK